MAAQDKIFDFQLEDIMDFCTKNTKLILGISVTVIGLGAIKKYFNGGVCYSPVRLDGKTVVITGGNTGIGKETAKDLAKRGARVILACRDITKGERAAADIQTVSSNKNVHVRVLDLSSLKSVQSFCDEIKKRESRIDILINNAGVMGCPEWKSEEGFDLQFAVNHLGHFHLTNELLDLMKASAPSRIVNVSSLAHTKGKIDLEDINFEKRSYDPWQSYRQSKLANVLFTRELHRRLMGTGVSVYSLHPGVVVTELGRHLTATMPMYKYFVLRYLVAPLVLKNAKQGAQTSIHCAVMEDIERDSGKYFSDCAVKESSAESMNDDLAHKLWDLSTRMIDQKLKKN